MRTRFFCRIVTLATIAALVGACTRTGPSPPSNTQWGQGLEQVKTAVVTASGYSPETIDVTASPAHLRISVADPKLSQADQLTRENSANSIVSAVESALAQQEQFTSIQVISVSIVHPAQADGTPTQTHTEDVLEFRKGPNQRFAHHIT